MNAGGRPEGEKEGIMFNGNEKSILIKHYINVNDIQNYDKFFHEKNKLTKHFINVNDI